MRIAFGTDEQTAVTDGIKALLASGGHEVVDVGEGIPWPDVGRRAAEAVVRGPDAGDGAERGIVCCWTGTGVSMAASKVPGARAALCGDAETARGARRWNDANVLAIGLRLTSADVAAEVIEAFLATDVDPAEQANIDSLEAPDEPVSTDG
jgi:ribose 5-phosphate isomerase B